MPSQPIELPPSVAQAFVRDMRAFFAAASTLKQDELAARQLQALNEYRRPRDKQLRLSKRFRKAAGAGLLGGLVVRSGF